jgi:multicomponent Na+:H+ antiporter subunit B
VTIPLELFMFGFLLVMAVAVLRMTDLFAAAMLTGLFSLIAASLMLLLDAVDVAFTEAAVGAGISTVLILGTLSFTAEKEAPTRRSLIPIAVVALTGAALIYGTLDMPHYGDPDAPIHHHVAPRYLYESESEVGVPNVVTAVLASYRGYDTLGELTVIFTAGVAVTALLGAPRRRPMGKDS